MLRAASRRWSCATRACRKLCRSLAALYSAFSRRSPCSRALRISLGRCTLSSKSSRWISSWSLFLRSIMLFWELPPRPRRMSGDTITAPRADAHRRDAPKPREPALQAAPRAQGARGRSATCACSRGRRSCSRRSPRASPSWKRPPRRGRRRRPPAPPPSPSCGSARCRSGGWRPSSSRRSRRRRRRRACSPSPAAPPSTRRRSSAGPPLVLVADGVQNPGNLGGLLRTAEAAGASGAHPDRGLRRPLLLEGAPRARWAAPSASPTSGGLPDRARRSTRSRRGASPSSRRPRTASGATTRPTCAARWRSWWAARAPACPPRVRERAAARLRIPLAGPVESLNVGVAAALVLFEAARQRGFRPRRRDGIGGARWDARATRRAARSSPSAAAGRRRARGRTSPGPTRRSPTACGRARSTRSSARRRCSAPAGRCAARSSRTSSARSSCGGRRARARRPSPS